jgi:hypothetical protein
MMQKEKLFNQLSRMTLIKKHHSTTNITVALSQEAIKEVDYQSRSIPIPAWIMVSISTG